MGKANKREVIQKWQDEEERNRLAAIVESTDDAVIGKDLDGFITNWNSGAEHTYGYTKEEAVGKHISLIIPENKLAEFRRFMDRLKQGEYVEPHETQRIRKDGSTIDVSLTLSPIYDSAGDIVGASAVARDITLRKQIERERDLALQRERRARQAAEQRQKQLEFLVQASDVLASSLEYETTLTNVAKLAVQHIADWCVIDLVQGEKIVRVTVEHVEEAKKQTAIELSKQFQTQGKVSTILQQVINSGESVLFSTIDETLLRELVDEEKFIEPVMKLGLESAMLVPLAVRDKCIGVLSLVNENPARVYTEKDLLWVQELAHYAALAVEDARLYTEVKQLNETLERRVKTRTEELEQANKELESFSYSVSHDLRAPLRAIQGFGNILMKEYSSQIPPDGTRYLQRIDENIKKMGALIDDLLTYSRVTRTRVLTRNLDMTQIVHEVLGDFQFNGSPAKPDIVIESLTEGEADRTLIIQVWQNLLSNAIKYTKNQMSPQIRVGSEIQDGIPVYFVQDNGVGFDVKYLDKAFEVFQRLHREEDYEGTGVGLAIVKHIIDSHGGTIWAKSEPGVGTTFFFTLGSGVKDG